MIKVNFKGRLCNNIIQYLGALVIKDIYNQNIITKPITSYRHLYRKTQHGPKIIGTETIKENFGKSLNIQYDTDEKYEDNKPTINITDKNLSYFLQRNNPIIKQSNSYNFVMGDSKLDNYYCQSSNILVNYRKLLLSKISINYKKKFSKDLLIHFRQGDMVDIFSDVDYVHNTIDQFQYRKCFLCSSNRNDKGVDELIDRYGCEYIDLSPLETLMFAINFNKLLLSAGSYSYMIHYLSRATQTIVYTSKSCPLFKNNAWNYVNANVLFYDNGKLENIQKINAKHMGSST